MNPILLGQNGNEPQVWDGSSGSEILNSTLPFLDDFTSAEGYVDFVNSHNSNKQEAQTQSGNNKQQQQNERLRQSPANERSSNDNQSRVIKEKVSNENDSNASPSTQQRRQQQQQQQSIRGGQHERRPQLSSNNRKLSNENEVELRLAYNGAPTIKLDWLDDGNNEFKLSDIHFHWGERRDNGSEHAIDGRRAAMEMHLVHIKHGLDKSAIGYTSDSVAVIAILIESHRKSNADFNPIVNELVRINATEDAQEIEYKSIYDLLPSNLDAFYTYSGSLTTPPCYQVVNWIVMAERLNMNAKQIEMFRNLYAPAAESEYDDQQQQQQHHRQQQQHRGRRPNAKQDQMETTPEHYGGGGGAGGAHHNHRNDKHYSMQSATTTGELEYNNNNNNDDERPPLIVPNVRLLQPLNNRTIMASFTKYGSRLEAILSGSNARVCLSNYNIIELFLFTTISSTSLLLLQLKKFTG